ncbi:hypothetical protein MAR_021902 [Mya arenaria]|uniref:SEA domain-containing protein n=1 Tax=Mya arenaria TaxID=6604 RepID=A0ABY7ECU4_MYAAR|nr:hypothetical protein MAR_021902 [Mya arenaria]
MFFICPLCTCTCQHISEFYFGSGVRAVYIYFVINVPRKDVPLNCTVPRSVATLADNIRQQLVAYMARYLGNIPFRITIRYMRIGSIQVNATIEKPDTLEASQRFSEAFFALDDVPFSIGGVPYNTSAIALNNTPIVTVVRGKPEDVCRVFLVDRGQCPNNGVCKVVDGTPGCFPAQVDDGEKLILGLAIGIPLFFLACLALVLCALLLYRRRMQKHADDSSSSTERCALDLV